MAAELSAVLGHIETISELVARRRRADQPRRRGRQRAARRRAGRRACRATSRSPQAPAVAGRRLPRPEPAGMSDARRSLTAKQAADARRRGRPRRHRALRGLPRQGRGRRAQRVHVGGRRGARRPTAPRGAPLAGVPLAVKDLFCTEGVPSQSGSKILEGYRPPYTRLGGRSASPPPARRCWPRPTRTSSRWAPRTRTPASARSLNPWDRTRVPGGSSGGSAAAVAAGAAPWALGTDTGGSIRQPAALTRHRRPQAHLRQRLALRDDRLRLVAGPGRPADPRRHRRGAALRPDDRPRPDGLDLAPAPRGDRAADRRAPRRHRASACPEAIDRRGHRARRLRALRGDAEARPGARRDVERVALPHAEYGISRLLRDRAGRGLVEPRALRRRPLRPARRGVRPAVDVHQDAPRRLRRRGQAPHHARDLRAVLRLLRRLLRQGPARPDQDRRGLRGRVRDGRLDRHARPRRPSPSSSAPRPTTRWRCTSTTCSRCRSRWPASRRSRSRPGCSEGLPVGFQLAGPAFSENRILDAAYALERAIGFDGDGREGRDHERASSTRRSSAWRSTSSWRRRPRCSAAAR